MNIKITDRLAEKSILFLPYSGNSLLTKGDRLSKLIGNIDRSLYYREDGNLYFVNNPANDHIIFCMDLGRSEDITYEKVRMEYAKIICSTFPQGFKNFIFCIPEVKQLETEGIAEAMSEGLLLFTYGFDKYKSRKANKDFDIYLYSEMFYTSKKTKAAYEDIVKKAELVCGQVNMARDLVNEPTNMLDPDSFISRLKEMVDSAKVTMEIYDREALRKNNTIGIYSVGKGSEHGPNLAILKYNAGPQYPSAALIGKGVTLDTGGINLKTGGNLSPMRTDMAGAATVLAAFNIITALGLKINLYCILPLVENLIGSKAIRPGEVIRYDNGLTVEINNTDAEGRLILADGILQAKKLKADMIINVATLTFNIGQALGTKVAGVFGDNCLSAEIIQAGLMCGEKFWQMPLVEEYRKALDSDIADIANWAPDGPSAITSALFLKEFVGDTEWAHLDIAATAFAAATDGYWTKGATGFGVRTLVKLFEERYKLE